MPKISGSCLCGVVRFELDDDFHQLNFCHCKQCQRATGSAHASNLFTGKDNLTWLSGKDKVKKYDVPGRAISNAFCTECGSGLPYQSGTGTALIVPAGTLNDEVKSAPVINNIFWTERADWYDAGIAADHHDAFPVRR